MKRLTAALLSTAIACAALFALAGCAQQATTSSTASNSSAATATSAASATPFATLGDVFAAERDSFSSTFDENKYACLLSSNGTWWHIEAALEKGMSEQLNEAWTEDESKVEELLSPLPVTLCEAIPTPSDEEVASLVGKKGSEIAADGFEFMIAGMVVNGNETNATATKGDFDYLLTFDGAVPDENTDDPAGALADLTVTTASIQGASWKILEQ